jgi:rhamnogalacturonyl hydrolase YesR
LSARGATVRDAWENALDSARAYLKSHGFTARYLKADFPGGIRTIDTAKLLATLKDIQWLDETLNSFFRFGIAFDDEFKVALLEQELNGNRILDAEDADGIVMKRMNSYLAQQGRDALEKLPDELTLFSCRGYINDEGECLALNYEQSGDHGRQDYGRRAIPDIDLPDSLRAIANKNIEFLKDSMKEDGSFVYGWRPCTDRPLDNYNILRHTGAVWSLIDYYRDTRDASVKPYIDRAVDYLLKTDMEYTDDGDAAYIVTRKHNEIEVGGNGLAICMLVNYMEVFDTDRYMDVCERLGEGILRLLDPDTGKYYHVLYFGEPGEKDFSRKDPFRTVFYDGESTYALCSMYRLTEDEKWLDSAKIAVENFIENDYEKYRDQWVAYSMNEITKYADDERYYAFALRNVQSNLKIIRESPVSYHTRMELLMTSFEMYDRMKREGISVLYEQTVFDEKAFIDTIFYRAEYMLNFCFFPEYAMYMANPSRIEDIFFVRYDSFRVRIDDIQHYLGGYRQFVKQYDRLAEYR